MARGCGWYLAICLPYVCNMFTTIVYQTPLVSKNLVDTWYPSGRIVRLSSQVFVVFPCFSFA